MALNKISSHLVSSDPADTGSTLAVPLQRTPVAIPAGNLSASFVSPPIYMGNMDDINLQMITKNLLSGTTVLSVLVGTGSIQQSNDSTWFYDNGAVQPYGVVNWSTISQTAFSGSVDVVTQLANQGFKWLRFSCSLGTTDGALNASFGPTGSMDCWLSAKSKGHG